MRTGSLAIEVPLTRFRQLMLVALVSGTLAGLAWFGFQYIAVLPLIAAAEPDLLISATFPHKLPASVLAIPRLGAFNLHPTLLPQGRGPNPQRLVYEGAETLGATLHQTTADFDAGAMFSRQKAPLPDDLTGEAICGEVALYSGPMMRRASWIESCEPYQ